MGLRLSDLPDHIRAKYEAQLGLERKNAVPHFHIEVTLGEGTNAKVVKMPAKPSPDEAHITRVFKQYINRNGSRNCKLVKTLQIEEA
jgi:hypothetical protein